MGKMMSTMFCCGNYNEEKHIKAKPEEEESKDMIIIKRPKANANPFMPDEKYINKYEREANFSFDSEALISFLTSEIDNLNGYTQKLDEPNIKIWAKENSQFNKDQPVVKGRYEFDANIDLQVLIALIFNKRGDWDKNIIKMDIKKVNEVFEIIYEVFKSPLPFMDNRDIYIKRIRFCKDGVYYAYFSSIPDPAVPPENGLVRGETIFSGSILKKSEEKYVYTTFSQDDFKALNVSLSMKAIFLPMICKGFYKEILKAIENESKVAKKTVAEDAASK